MSEPENIVLQQLREIRAALDVHAARVELLAQTLHEILTRLTGIERLLVTIYGKQTEGEQRLARLEARVERLEKAAEDRT